MKLYEKILWRIFIFPLVLVLIIPISFFFFMLGMDNDWYDTRKTLFYLWDIGFNGLYIEEDKNE